MRPTSRHARRQQSRANLGHGDGAASPALPTLNKTRPRTHTPPAAASGTARQEVIMNHPDRISRSLASLTRRAGALLTYRAAVPAAAATPRPQPPRENGHSPSPAPARMTVTAEPRSGTRPPAPRERLRTRILPARLPHAIQLCIHCRERPAGFWVSRAGGNTVRRPWCLSCCEQLDQDHCRVIRFPS
jgi:hypothetical protein